MRDNFISFNAVATNWACRKRARMKRGNSAGMPSLILKVCAAILTGNVELFSEALPLVFSTQKASFPDERRPRLELRVDGFHVASGLAGS
jgi:hypothetical protein